MFQSSIYLSSLSFSLFIFVTKLVKLNLNNKRNEVIQLRTILVIYLSLLTNAFYSYNFGKEAGDYTIVNIPFGTYEVIAQKIGFNNGVSQIVTIDSLNNQLFNIDVSFLISDVENDDDNIFPSELLLHPGYPNPFNPSTNISFSLPIRQISN